MFNMFVEKYRTTLISLLVLILAVSSVACGQSSLPAETVVSPTATPTVVMSGRGVGDTLQVMFWEAPTILNPHLSSAYKDWEPSRVTYEPLASFDPDGNLVPFLAAEIPSLDNGGVASDGKSVTWKLKQGVKWSDGAAFTAADVLFTYDYVTNPEVASSSAPTYDNVESVEVIDDYTFKVNFKEATPTWDVPFIGIQGMILPKHVFEAYNGANAREAPANLLPIGTGPYRVKAPGIKPQEVIFLGSELVETNKIVYEPNPHFREEDKPFFRRVEWRGGITAGEAARSVLKDGDVDYVVDISSISTDELVGLEEEGTGRLVTVLGPGVERIALNRTDPKESAAGERSSVDVPHPFFSDKTVRQAFAYAIDRESIAALNDFAGSATSHNLVTPPRYSSPNSFYSFDLERAAALLDEAGWVDTNSDRFRDKDGVKMKVIFQAPEDQTAQQTQRIVKEDLESIGVEVDLKITAASDMFSDDPAANPNDYRRFNADMLLYQESTFSPDPTQYMQNWTCSQIPQKSNNWSAGLNIERWCNEEYNTLYEQVRTELDPDKRQEIFIQMNDIMIEDVVMIPLVHKAWVSGANAEIEGINLTPWDNELWNVKDWRYR